MAVSGRVQLWLVVSVVFIAYIGGGMGTAVAVTVLCFLFYLLGLAL